MKTKLFFSAMLICLAVFSYGQIIHVPADQATIQAGINEASDGDTVLVSEGTYFENIRFMGKAITVASEYIMDADTNHINNTIIDGSQATEPDSASTVMFINGEDTTSIINGFTIKGGGGLVNITTYSFKFGGGIACFDAGAKIVNNKIIENLVTHSFHSCGGAGIGSYLTTDGNWIVITDNTISNNISIANSFSAYGGGISLMSNAIIKNNTIEQNTCNNTGMQADGGGIEIWQESGPALTVYIIDNTIRYNTVDGTTYGYGAGIKIIDGPVVNIMNNIIENNSCNASYSYGGGIYIENSGKSVISNNEINENKLFAENFALGGGICIEYATDTIVINKNMISNNYSNGIAFGGGGGIGIFDAIFEVVYLESNYLKNNYALNKGGGLFTYNTYGVQIANNVFLENEAVNVGGAIFFRQNLGKNENEESRMFFTDRSTFNGTQNRDDNFHPIIVNNNFISNHANEGGAIGTDHEIETPIIFNSIFWNNTASNGMDIHNQSNLDMLVYNNNIDTTMIISPWLGKDNINVDPEFVNDSYHLSWSSYCANAGIDSLEVNGIWYWCPVTDIDGDERPYLNTRSDIGVDETRFVSGIASNNVLENLALRTFPNPFTTSTTIEYEINQTETVSITFYNQFGKQLDEIKMKQTQGKHQFSWNAEHMPAGIYYCVLKTKYGIQATKMIKLN